jgi:cytidylate kinase
LTEAARQAAARGKVVLVGRGTGHLLSDMPNVLHLRLVAAKEWRVRRMMAREGWTQEHALARCTEEDRVRAKFTRYFFGEEPFQAARYHLTFNTGRVPLDEVVGATVALIQNDWSLPSAPASRAEKAMTLTSELGAGGTGFAAALAANLGLRVYDRDLLLQEVARLGVPESELEKIDEQSAGIIERFRSGSLHQRYFEAMQRIMNDLAAHGAALLVGRGGNRFLRDHPRAFHVRLVAPPLTRVRQVMEQRWMAEGPVRKLIADNDAKRRRFLESYFGADCSDPLEYHITVNSGLLGQSAVDLTAFAAERHWTRNTETPEPTN